MRGQAAIIGYVALANGLGRPNEIEVVVLRGCAGAGCVAGRVFVELLHTDVDWHALAIRFRQLVVVLATLGFCARRALCL